MSNKRREIIDEKIYELREQGLTYAKIAEYFKEQGEEISCDVIQNRCNTMYRLMGMKNKKRLKEKEVTDEEIYELRKKGLTYEEIHKYFCEQGKNVSYGFIEAKCQRIRQKTKKRNVNKTKIEDIDIEICNLRKKGITYKQIIDHFRAQGKEVTIQEAWRKCEKVYKLVDKEEFMANSKKIEGTTDEELFYLRERGLTYQQIVDYLKEHGIETNLNKVRDEIKKIYRAKGKKELRGNSKRTPGITGEEINNLRGNRENYNIENDSEALRKQILNLQETKGATKAQMEQIAKLYGISLEEENEIKMKNDENDDNSER